MRDPYKFFLVFLCILGEIPICLGVVFSSISIWYHFIFVIFFLFNYFLKAFFFFLKTTFSKSLFFLLFLFLAFIGLVVLNVLMVSKNFKLEAFLFVSSLCFLEIFLYFYFLLAFLQMSQVAMGNFYLDFLCWSIFLTAFIFALIFYSDYLQFNFRQTKISPKYPWKIAFKGTLCLLFLFLFSFLGTQAVFSFFTQTSIKSSSSTLTSKRNFSRDFPISSQKKSLFFLKKEESISFVSSFWRFLFIGSVCFFFFFLCWQVYRKNKKEDLGNPPEEKEIRGKKFPLSLKKRKVFLSPREEIIWNFERFSKRLKIFNRSRHRSQSPLEYFQNLAKELPDKKKEFLIFQNFFLKARYSDIAILEEEVERVKKIRKALEIAFLLKKIHHS